MTVAGVIMGGTIVLLGCAMAAVAGMRIERGVHREGAHILLTGILLALVGVAIILVGVAPAEIAGVIG